MDKERIVQVLRGHIAFLRSIPEGKVITASMQGNVADAALVSAIADLQQIIDDLDPPAKEKPSRTEAETEVERAGKRNGDADNVIDRTHDERDNITNRDKEIGNEMTRRNEQHNRPRP